MVSGACLLGGNKSHPIDQRDPQILCIAIASLNDPAPTLKRDDKLSNACFGGLNPQKLIYRGLFMILFRVFGGALNLYVRSAAA